MQTSQHSAHELQQGASNLLPSQALQSQAPQQQLMPQIQYQQMGLQQQPNPLQQDMQQMLQASGSLLQQSGVLDQQKQLYQLQRPLPETSSNSPDSTVQTGQPSGGDWQEEVYQKIKTMKERYLPVLSEIYQKIATKLQQLDSLPCQPKSNHLGKLKVFKMMLERLITFLEVSKSNISHCLKEKLGSYEKQILRFINMSIPWKMSSLDSTAQTGQPSRGDWQEEVYQKIKAMKERYLPELSEIYQKITTKLQQHDSLAHQLNSDQLETLKVFQMTLERQITFFQISKKSISPSLKEKLGSYEKQIIIFINTIRPRKISSLDSTAQTGQPSGGDWQEEIYQKIKAMKESYLPELREIYQKIATKLQQFDSLPHQPKSDQLEKLKVFKMRLERLITFLEVSKSNISPSLKEKLDSYERQIINSINTVRPRKMSSLQPGQLPPPHIHSMSQTQQPHQSNDVNDMKMRQGIGVKPGFFEQHLGNALAPSSGKSTVTEEPMDHLIKAVSSLTLAALSATVSDISSVISMTDRIAGSTPGNGSRFAVGENSIPQDGANRTRRMKRCINATPLNASIKQLTAMEASDLELTAISNIKKLKIEF